MKKQIVCAAALVALALPSAATAGNSGTGAEYGTQPGFAQSLSNTQCAGHGAFGYFGKNNNLGIKSDPTDPGANGNLTAYNNSTLCGNPQGAAGTP